MSNTKHQKSVANIGEQSARNINNPKLSVGDESFAMMANS